MTDQEASHPSASSSTAPPKLKQITWSYIVLLLFALSSIMLDQWTKSLVRANLAFGESWYPWPDQFPILRIIHWGNQGAAFGLFQGGGAFFAILAIVVALLILFYFPRVDHQNWMIRLAMGLQMGGALGNFVDRLSIGYVTDWLALGSFPVFNVADASITVGAIVLLIFTWASEKEEKRTQGIRDLNESES